MAERVRFENPPVVEVVCGVLFGALTGLHAAHVGLFWEQIRGEFSLVDETAPLSPMIEILEPPQSVEIEVGFVPPLARTWFYRPDRRGLIQLQRDRFVYNWKRSSPQDGEYPSYDQVIVDFERLWGRFQAFIDTEKIGGLISGQQLPGST